MLEVKSDGPVLYCTLDRPEVRNAFNDQLIDLLTHAFTHIPDGTRAVVLSGNGKSFCAGGDLEWMKKAANYSEEMNYHDALKLGGLFEAVAKTPAVVIAKIHGAAFGGGCGLVAASDVAIAAEDTVFAFSEVRLGLIPGTISPFVIPKIGAGNARALFTTGESFTAEKALRIGLIHESVPVDKLDELVEQKLNAVLAAGPDAVAAAKDLVLSSPLGLEECAQRLATARSSAEGKEGIAAFLEKRKASYVVER